MLPTIAPKISQEDQLVQPNRLPNDNFSPESGGNVNLERYGLIKLW